MRSRSIALVVALVLVGCGVYSFKGEGLGGIKTIAVEPFGNRTTEFGIREEITNAVITKLLGDRTLTVVSPSGADAILTGTLVSVDDRPLTYHSDETVTEYQVSIVIEARLTRPDQAEPLWQGRLVGVGNYPYKTGSLEERQAGLKIAVDRLVQDLLNRLTSDW